jgi:hypothetical protein
MIDIRQRSEPIVLEFEQGDGAASQAVPTGDGTAGFRMVSKVPSSVQISTSVYKPFPVYSNVSHRVVGNLGSFAPSIFSDAVKGDGWFGVHIDSPS